MSGSGATSVAPDDGQVLWEHRWGGCPIVQPAVTADGDVLIVASAGSGTRRLAVARGPGGWTASERWTSHGLKPYFNDFVVHEGHAFGFDGRILACIDLEDGARKWKGGRYGNGQLVAAARPGPAAGAVGRRRAGAGPGHARPVHGARARSRPSRARRGTTPSWSATSCWCATARRWPRSDWLSRTGPRRIGINHGHIYGQVDAVAARRRRAGLGVREGARLVAAFTKQYPAGEARAERERRSSRTRRSSSS